MDYVKLLVLAVFFYLLTPGVLLALPPGASHQVQAATHAVVFTLVITFVWPLLKKTLRV
jgi:quercetin dioxygenase-like cupin family protein